MKVTMVRCDNPACKTTGEPESLTPYVPPYGWLRLKGDLVGCGPAVDIEVCSDACATPAVSEAVRRGREDR